ncbi:MAG: hypothetical protein R3208_14085 [Ketobacteraceae bacterium]|nr:hypothetical protein [Ketobacteraceae bacterium]
MATLAEKLAARKKAKEQSAIDDSNNADVSRATPPPRKTESSGALLRQQMNAANIDQSVRYVDIELIDIEEQVRTSFDLDYIQDLAIDFTLNEAHPFQPKSPITLYERPNGRFLLDTGENRVRAVKYGRDNREALGVNDVTAFTQIRASIIGPEPEKIKRVQSQVKENILRDDLNYVELGRALEMFFQENPNATQAQAAEWCGFKNANSGRVKVNTALKLMKLDQDLIDQVAADELAVQRAFAEQEQRTQTQASGNLVDSLQDASDTNSAPSKPAPKKAKPKKQQTISLPLEVGVELISLINWAAKKEGLDEFSLKKSPSRKDVMDAINSDELKELMKRISG